MVIAFQVILLFVILISFIGFMGERNDKDLRNGLMYICVISSLAMLAMVILL